MPTVTGSLRDITDLSIGAMQPEIIFTIVNPQANLAGRIYPTQPVIVKPGGSGDWQAKLAQTTDMLGDAYYRVQLRWLSPTAGTTIMDFPDWRVYVSEFGGTFAECLARPADITNRRILHVGLEEPENPSLYSFFLEMDPDDPHNPETTGKLYMYVQEGE